MSHGQLVSLASVIVLGIGAQWVAWRLRMPSILLLLVVGILAGPIFNMIDPGAMMGSLLYPLVSISVALILFEGGLSLKFSELPKVGGVVRNLVSIGALVTVGLVAVAAHFILDIDWSLAILAGAILSVTGPTVIGPLLTHIRPSVRLGSILKWEGILIDPIGAILAVLVFEAIVAQEIQAAASVMLIGVLKSLLIGGLIGLIGAAMMIILLKRYMIPDFLHNGVTLMLVVSAHTCANLVHQEAGLLAVTLMGIILANQRSVTIRHIVEFKETLRVLLISMLFILLGSNLKLDDLRQINMHYLYFIGVLVFLVRPLSVLISTFRSELRWNEKLLLAWMAPRGIVAAAVATIFSFELVRMGYDSAYQIVPLVYFIIIATVAIYGLTAPWVAKSLKLSQQNPQGVLIVGANLLARSIGKVLQKEGLQTLLVDSNWSNIAVARMVGLPAYYGNILSDHVLNDIELIGIGRLLALSSNDETNSLASLHFMNYFGRAEVYQLPPERDLSGGIRGDSPQHLRGRFLFGDSFHYNYFSEAFANNATVSVEKIDKENTLKAIREKYDELFVPMFIINETRELMVLTTDGQTEPTAGQSVICLTATSTSS